MGTVPRTNRSPGLLAGRSLHETITKFGYPDTLVRSYEHWVVLLRPQQATLGALILACTESVEAFSDVSAAAMSELGTVISNIESTLSARFDYQKINYLMLMMVDPHVHFHVLPRYAGPTDFSGVTFLDPGWPGPPQIGSATEIDGDGFERLRQELIAIWPK